MDTQLLDFTQKALVAGVSRADIAEVLRRAGWPKPDIESALRAFAEVEFPVPVPKPKPYLSAREVFIYLVLFGALYVAALNFGALVFELINRAYPDPSWSAAFGRFSADRIRWNLSAVVVAFPIFLLTFRAITRNIAADPTKRASRPRKWLTYLTLFACGVSLTIDVTALVYNFLGGELTVRFLLKIATVASIAGGIFCFFLGDMRKEEREELR